MTFEQITGNEDVKRVLAGMISSGKIPHAIMFHEDDGGGAMSLVLAFLQMLYCKNPGADDSCGACPSCNKISKMIHPDVHFIYPVASGNLSVAFSQEWRSLVSANQFFTEDDFIDALGIESKSALIAVPEAKSLLECLSLSALEGGYRSVVVYLPERMNQEAANRLLKIVEEPPQMTQFLFVTHAPEKVLRTISSRCQQIRVMPVKRDRQIPSDNSNLFSELMNALVSKNLCKALEAGEKISALPSRESAKAFCNFAGERLRLLFICQQGIVGLETFDEKTLEWAGKCRKTFPRNAIQAFDRARMLVERNVNMKILFTDLVDRLIIAV